MSLVIPAVGENRLMEYMTGKVTPGDYKLKLFVNDITPASTDTVSTYTEMSTQGYASATLTMSSWSVAQASGKAEASYPVVTFTFDGTGGDTTVYGYFVTDNAGTTLLFAERFINSETITTSGEYIKMSPKLRLYDVNG